MYVYIYMYIYVYVYIYTHTCVCVCVFYITQDLIKSGITFAARDSLRHKAPGL